MNTFTRSDYMNRKCTHREYYSQFVNEEVKNKVLFSIGLEALRNSKDEHFNDIPLRKWDGLGLSITPSISFDEVGDSRSLAGLVCIVKEAAKQLVEGGAV